MALTDRETLFFISRSSGLRIWIIEKFRCPICYRTTLCSSFLPIINSWIVDIAVLTSQAKVAEEKIRKIHNTTDYLKAEYIKITSNSKTATANANNAAELIGAAELKQEELKETYDKVKAQLEERESGNEERKQRAEQLRQRTTELLAKIKSSREAKSSLIERADALDIELAGFRSTIERLNEQVDQVAADIDHRVQYHDRCDV